jgi:hypothetical protein
MRLLTWICDHFNPHFSISKYAIGRYIINAACLLHLSWAGLLCFDIRAGNSTPVSILFYLGVNNRLLVILSLIMVSASAHLFLNLRLRQVYNTGTMSLLLLPQQLLLWCSAGAGIYATVIQRYADGVYRPWAHILADQLPVIITALLYTVAVIESGRPPILIKNVSIQS